MLVCGSVKFCHREEVPRSRMNRCLSAVALRSPWTGRKAQFLGGGVPPLAGTRCGCCCILRQTRKAARLGTCGKAAVSDQLTNSETGTSSGAFLMICRKCDNELAGPGYMATCGPLVALSKPPPGIGPAGEPTNGDECEGVPSVHSVECPLAGVEAGCGGDGRVTTTKATV